MPWPNISIANMSDSKAFDVRVHVRRRTYQEKGTMLTSFTSMPWSNIPVADISDSKALDVTDHVRRGSC